MSAARVGIVCLGEPEKKMRFKTLSLHKAAT